MTQSYVSTLHEERIEAQESRDMMVNGFGKLVNTIIGNLVRIEMPGPGYQTTDVTIRAMLSNVGDTDCLGCV